MGEPLKRNVMHLAIPYTLMRRILSGLALLFVLLSGRDALACICGPQRLTARAELEASEEVFVGKVVDVVAVESWSAAGSGYVTEFVIRMKVLESFKGPKRSQITVKRGNSLCDVRLYKGEKWLVFANNSGGSLLIGGCSRSQPAAGAIFDLRCLRRGVCPEICSDCIKSGDTAPMGSIVPKPIKPKDN